MCQVFKFDLFAKAVLVEYYSSKNGLANATITSAFMPFNDYGCRVKQKLSSR